LWLEPIWTRDALGEALLFGHLPCNGDLHCVGQLAYKRAPSLRRGHDILGGASAVHGNTPVEHHGYSKLLALLTHVESQMEAGSVASFHAAVECFAMRSHGAWLKVAGGQKAEVLEVLAINAPPMTGGAAAALELGCFIGYTAARFSTCLPQATQPHMRGQTVSVESDPIHTALARHFLDLVCKSHTVEVQLGALRDVVALSGEDFGKDGFGLVFMDQRGTGFHVDRQLLERLELLQNGNWAAAISADNVLRPGAPVFAWSVAWQTAQCVFLNEFWSLPEFLEENAGVEDWIAVAHGSSYR